MIETQVACRRGAAPLSRVLPALLLLWLAAAALPARETPTPRADSTLPTAPAAREVAAQQSDVRHTEELSEGHGECHPPSTQEWVLIGAGSLVIFVFCFFLLVRLVQRSFIRRDRNATLGRHFGISLTFLVSSLGMTVLAYLITGCLHHQLVVWLFFPLALWVLHGLYTLIVVRSE
ncbi:MAG: hypothetical protein M3O15_01295 [Acidobacteriota bacterium]|nr:hypothetical protein [Acidobacteriota bacterium]